MLELFVKCDAINRKEKNRTGGLVELLPHIQLVQPVAAENQRCSQQAALL